MVRDARRAGRQPGDADRVAALEDLPQAEPGHAGIEGGQHMLDRPLSASAELVGFRWVYACQRRDFERFSRWGGWGSNPRPADYENYGPTLRMRCLHGYHGVVAPMALIAPFAPMTRSTNRSTTTTASA
jgi:hypothetical protein